MGRPQGRELHGHPTLDAFLKKVLDEATQFMDDLPLTFRGGSSKSSPPPIADVGRLSRANPRAQLAEIPLKHTSAIRRGNPTRPCSSERHGLLGGTGIQIRNNMGQLIFTSSTTASDLTVLSMNETRRQTFEIVEWGLPHESNKALGITASYK